MYKKTYFWTSETDAAIIQFTQMTPGPERNALYTEQIHSVFQELVSVYFYKYRYIYSIPDREEFIDYMVPELYRYLTEFEIRSSRKISLYSYFYRLIKHLWLNRLLVKSKGNDGNKKDTVFIADISNHSQSSNTIWEPSYTPSYDSELDMPVLISDLCNSISADIDNQRYTAENRNRFGIALIDYLKTHGCEGFTSKDLSAHLAKTFPEISRQRRNNYLRHYRNVIRKRC